MGSRMAMNLHAAGHSLRVFNRSKEKTKPFADKGIEVCDSPAAAAKGAEFVCSIVSDDVATREVMLGADGKSGVVGAAAPGTIILDSSTNTPAMSREVAKAAAARGVVYLDAPVSGSLAQAQGKELVILVGGDKAAFDKAQPVLLAMGRMVRRIGDSGAGATLKLINNMLSASLTAAIARGGAGRRSGQPGPRRDHGSPGRGSGGFPSHEDQAAEDLQARFLAAVPARTHGQGPALFPDARAGARPTGADRLAGTQPVPGGEARAVRQARFLRGIPSSRGGKTEGSSVARRARASPR